VSIVLRIRRATGDLRRQLKWSARTLVYAILVGVLASSQHGPAEPRESLAAPGGAARCS
jgi:hypothetical protein